MYSVYYIQNFVLHTKVSVCIIINFYKQFYNSNNKNKHFYGLNYLLGCGHTMRDL